tara:strand:+ start:335 stop:541 length:207 start_codon:yes stop_codon:yes gene_type:complete
MGIKKKELISLKEAAHILGYQQHTPILGLIKNNYLKVQSKENSKRRWLRKEDVLSLPQISPVIKSKKN